MRWILRFLGLLAGLAVLLVGFIWLRYGGGDPAFEDRTAEPLLAESALELVANLKRPPGNLAVSSKGRLFFTIHSEAAPEVKLAELVNGVAVPYPDEAFQSELQSVLSVRIDRQNRLWALDNGNHGLGRPRLLAFDLATGETVYDYDFPREIAGWGSHLNDFQVDPQGKRVYIADASIFGKRPALVVVDLERKAARRLLDGHESVVPEPYVPVVAGRKMLVFGIFAIRPGVDSIALDKRGDWLYFAPVTNNSMYRIRRSDLDDERLSSEEVASRVERFAKKTMSDGITMDRAGNLYLSDLEHSAIVRLDPEGRLRTLIRDPRLRWPDGFSFGPGGWLYVACSALHHVIGRSASHIESEAPYQIFRLRPGARGVPGH